MVRIAYGDGSLSQPVAATATIHNEGPMPASCFAAGDISPAEAGDYFSSLLKARAPGEVANYTAT